jgi:hypothetical protein
MRSDSGQRPAAARPRAPHWTKVADEAYGRPDDARTQTEDTDARQRAVASDRLRRPTLDSVHGMCGKVKIGPGRHAPVASGEQ